MGDTPKPPSVRLPRAHNDNDRAAAFIEEFHRQSAALIRQLVDAHFPGGAPLRRRRSPTRASKVDLDAAARLDVVTRGRATELMDEHVRRRRRR